MPDIIDPDPRFSREALAERLKSASIELIAAHRDKRQAVLDDYARQSGVWPASTAERPPRLFMKLIQIYHPDRLEPLLAQVAAMRAAGDVDGLARLAAQLAPRSASRAGPAEAVDFEYRWGVHPADFGFGEHEWGDHAEGGWTGRERRRRGVNILEALRREHFGNLELQLTREDLEEMDGEIELPDMEIDDLTGIQLSRHIDGLNLSSNLIEDVAPLRFLRHLRWLDLSNNRIEEIDGLERLRRLEELDLSGNMIDDISAVADLPQLRLLNLAGNPLRQSAAALAALAARGVVLVGV